ncbi:MAG: DUF1329 domain-containing protein [Pseudomonadales bacterium]|nr:DUF1329 domain-containing protein [Pseudomonadales bacterium]
MDQKVSRWLAGCGLLIAASTALCAVPPEVAARLGTTLTPMGANPAGNAEGTIPPWTGTLLGVPKGVTYKGSGTHYPSPYPDEKPQFVITAKNYKQYLKNLTDGQIALFEKYPDTFQMPIYKSHRDVRYSDRVHENTKLNALHTGLKSDGNGADDVYFGTPFPIPGNAAEVLWNHMASPMMGASEGVVDAAAVYSNGEVNMRQSLEQRHVQYYSSNITREQFNDTNVAAMVMVQMLAPPREKGMIVLVHEYKDVSDTSRDAWVYLPGTRRVRRSPSIAYDFPDSAGGLRTVDDAMLFNGANSRYTWKLEGTRELFIPYNNNALDDPQVSYKELLTKNHLNTKYMRYELHRCHVILAELRPGKRHIYAKRRLYTDEDTWAAVLADNYDSQGNLWRTNFRSMVDMYDLPGMGARMEVYHDLQKGAYLANYLVNEQKGPPRFVDQPPPDSYFTPTMVRQLGK